MPASEKAVAAVMEALGCIPVDVGTSAGLVCFGHASWTDRGCPVAVAAADAATDTDRPTIQAQALRDTAEAERTAMVDCPECLHALPWLVASLETRADRIEAQP